MKKPWQRRFVPVLLLICLLSGLALLILPPMLQNDQLTREAEEEEEFYQLLKPFSPEQESAEKPGSAQNPSPDSPQIADWNPFPDSIPYFTGLPRFFASALEAIGENITGVLYSGSRFGKYSRSTDIISPVDDPDAYNRWLTQPEPPPAGGYTGADLESCKRQNSDFIAWLQIPGTNVDYPVVQSDNTTYYLNHTFSGKSSSLGTLFSLGKADWKTPGRNIAIYGHDVEGSGNKMFKALLQYKKKSFFRKHPDIYLDSIYHSGVYRIFAVFDITLGDFDPSAASFSSEKSFQRFISKAQNISLYDTGTSVPEGSTIVSLITCDRYFKRKVGRFIVMAVKIR